MHARLRYLCGVSLLLAAGCSQPPRIDEKYANVAQARELLVTALDAWKAGDLSQLERRKPSLRFADDDCSAGCALVAYEVPADESAFRPFTGIPVRLQLILPGGQKTNRDAFYQVTIEPLPSVLRADP